MTDDVELTIVTMRFDASDPATMGAVLAKYVVLTRMQPGCRNVDLCASVTHPGRYAATTGLTPTGPDDPLAVAMAQALQPFEAVLRGYDLAPQDRTHALRALRSAFHGFATLQADGGFQWSTDIDTSFEWLIDLVDRGLRSAAGAGSDGRS